MIAGCPKCGARYRVDREKLGSAGVRLRCAKCEAVFRVRAPEAGQAPSEQTQLSPIPAPLREPAQAEAQPAARVAVAPPPAAKIAPPPAAPPEPVGDLVLIAIPEPEIAKQLAHSLAARGLRSVVAHDGVEAMLEIQRKLPKAAIVAAHLPKMYGFQICELVKRNDSLRGTWLVLVGAIHNQERYRRPAGETYGADAYLEMPELPDGAFPLLAQGGVRIGAQAAHSAPAPAARRETAPVSPLTEKRAPPLPRASQPLPLASHTPLPLASHTALAPSAPSAPSEGPRVADGLEEQRAKAERLARIIVSDIVLYNEQKFAAALRQGNVVEALDGDLSEGRHLFQERIDARVRGERDFLADELLRIAKQRGMK
jgi:predicted Zn finger-like uncharacterized protein